jgi:hypothetical protein
MNFIYVKISHNKSFKADSGLSLHKNDVNVVDTSMQKSSNENRKQFKKAIEEQSIM